MFDIYMVLICCIVCLILLQYGSIMDTVTDIIIDTLQHTKFNIKKLFNINVYNESESQNDDFECLTLPIPEVIKPVPKMVKSIPEAIKPISEAKTCKKQYLESEFTGIMPAPQNVNNFQMNNPTFDNPLL